MSRPYHVLFARESATDRWTLEFGDYDKSTVVYERQTYRDNDYKASNLKVITSTSDKQACLNAIMARLNNEL